MNNLTAKYQDKVTAIRSSFNRQAKSISDNQQWHQQAKAEVHQELRKKINQELQSLKDQLYSDQQSRIKELEPKLFAVDDHPSLQMVYRDAIQRANAVAEHQEQLLNLMDQSIDTGDKTLAKGVAYVAAHMAILIWQEMLMREFIKSILISIWNCNHLCQIQSQKSLWKSALCLRVCKTQAANIQKSCQKWQLLKSTS